MENRDNNDKDNFSRSDRPNDASDTSRDVASRRREVGDSEVDFGEETDKFENIEPNKRSSRRIETEH